MTWLGVIVTVLAGCGALSLGVALAYLSNTASCCWFFRHDWRIHEPWYVDGQRVQWVRCRKCGVDKEKVIHRAMGVR